MKQLAIIFALLCGSAAAQVTCYAITPSTSGSGTGASWTNAHGGVPSLTRGTRYYFADGSYGTYTFSTAASGTTTIEFRKAQSYDFGRTADGCSNDISSGFNASTMGSSQAKFSGGGTGSFFNVSGPYFVLNGNGTQAAPGCGGGGAITATVNVATSPPTPSDCGFVLQGTGTNHNDIEITGGTNVTMEYVDLFCAAYSDSGGDGEYCFRFISGGTNTLVSHMYAHNSGAVYVVYAGNNSTFDHSYFWGTEVTGANGAGATHGQAEQAISSSGQVRSNNVYRDMVGTSVFTWLGGGTDNNWEIYNNTFVYSAFGTVNTTNGSSGACPSNCVSLATGTAFQQSSGYPIYIGATSSTAPHASTAFTVGTVYSSTLLSVTTAPGTLTGVTYYSAHFGGTSDNAIDCINSNTCTNFTIVQNNFVNCLAHGDEGNACGIGFADGASGCSATIENNLFYGNVGSAGLSQCASMTLTEDYNSSLNSGSFGTGAHDVHVASGAPNPFVGWPSSNFNLASDNADWNNRLSLSPPYTVDVNGVPLTTDRGAYQFTSGSQASSPSCSPGTGTYSSTQTVTCTNPNSGTTVMCYSTSTTPVTNGAGTGCTTGTQYTTTISVSASETLNVVAGTSILPDSSMVSYVYTISSQAATPTLTPGTGTYNSNQTVTLSTASTGTVIICWATGATTPVTNGAGTGCSTGTSAANNSTITVSSSETVNAVAGTSTQTDSTEASATYTLVVNTPTFSPAAGAYSSAQSVTISVAGSSAVIHYAINATPTCSSTTYSTAIAVNVSETLEAIGCLSGYSNSAVGTAAYVIGGMLHVSGACSKVVTETETTGNSWTASCTPATAGDAIPMFVQCHPTSGTITGITLTSPGWTITQLVPPASTGSNSWGSIFGAIAPNTSAATFTATFTGASNCSNFAIFLSDEFSGNSQAGGSITFNATGSNSGGASTCNQSAANVTPPLNNEAVWNACLLGSATTATSPWTLGSADGNGNSAEYQILSGGAGSPLTPAFNGSSGAYIIGGVAIAPPIATVPSPCVICIILSDAGDDTRTVSVQGNL